MAGRLVLVVGPSGAGKDTLITEARFALADDGRFVFPKRVVTRDAVASLEDHESVSPEAFATQRELGCYALSWTAHGLSYGLPSSLTTELAAGRVVVCNGSRAVVADALAKFPGTLVVLIEADAEKRAARLMGRGRETVEEIGARLAREVPVDLPGAVRIDNSGQLREGVGHFVAVLKDLVN